MRLVHTETYPFLLVVVRVLYVAANNPGEFSTADLLLTLLTSLAATAVLFGMAWLLLPQRRRTGLPALLTFLVIAWVVGAPALEASVWSPPPPDVTAVLASLTGLLILAGIRWPTVLRVGATYLTYTFGLLALWLSGDLALDALHQQQATAGSRLIHDLSRPIVGSRSRGAPARDVYLIALDEYANSTVLRYVAGYDNRPFEDSLRALGFHVPHSVSSNYVHTHLSLASLLNAAHVQSLEGDLPRGTRDRTLANYLIEHSRVARFLQERGYRLVYFPSAWYHPTNRNPLADSVVEIGPTLSVGRLLSRTGLRRSLWQRSPIAWFYREAAGDAEIVQGTLEHLSRLPEIRGPVFAVAHVINPHRPYVFTSSCTIRPAGWRKEAALYVEQLQCLNRILLATVTRIIRQSELAPIIILQGDHGTSFLQYSTAADASLVSLSAAHERFGAFGAYYLPGTRPDALGDTVSVVNVLGHVLREYFGAILPPEPNVHYLSLEKTPFEFRQMDAGWVPPLQRTARASH